MFPDSLIAVIAGAITQQILSPVPEVSTVKCILSFAAANSLLIARTILTGNELTAVSSYVFRLNASFLGSLVFFTLLYRAFFHPLRKFPSSSRLATLTKLYEFRINLQGTLHTYLRDQHLKHGDFVRTGPHDLSICNVEAIHAILSRTSPCTRGAFYEVGMINGGHSVHTVRNKREHAIWRRIWDKGFSSQNLQFYAQYLEKHVRKLVSAIEKLKGEEVEGNKIIGNMTFDIMSELGFGIDFGMQDGIGDASYLEFLHNYMGAAMALGTLRNLLLRHIPAD